VTTLGADIRKRREQLGFSAAELARLAALQEPRLLAIEAGTVPLTTTELSSLADALACNAADLARGRSDDPRRSVARFRGAITTEILNPQDLRLLARAAEAGRILASLRARLGEPLSGLQRLRSPSAPSAGIAPWEHGYELGAATRERLDPSRSAIPSVQGFLEEHGVHVAAVDFESAAIEAASLYEIDAAPVILINRRAAKFSYSLARRALLAHEVCHLLNDGGERDLTVVSRETDSSPIEQRANGFAPSFIAPGPWISLHSVEPVARARELALTWGLSFEGAAWHLKNIKLISAATAEQLFNMKRKPQIEADFEQPLNRTPPDQFDVESEPSPLALGLLSETAIIAAAEGVISRGRAAEILTLR
jgi:Zn-dependent peptidase ImmA (M78 family)/transcriptional regulator with XRE-family HTH domain